MVQTRKSQLHAFNEATLKWLFYFEPDKYLTIKLTKINVLFAPLFLVLNPLSIHIIQVKI